MKTQADNQSQLTGPLVLTASLLMLSAWLARAEGVLFESLKIGDATVKNVRVVKDTPTEVVVLFDGGGTTLKRQDLPPELQKLYPYDPQAAADFNKKQVAEQEERDQRARTQQAKAAKEFKASLLQQQAATKSRIEDLEKQLHQFEKEMKPMRGKAAGKPRSTARTELDAARDKKQDLIHRLGIQKDLLGKINKQLDVMP
jgi:hypothetical protein